VLVPARAARPTSDHRGASEPLAPGFHHPILLITGSKRLPRGPAYTRLTFQT